VADVPGPEPDPLDPATPVAGERPRIPTPEEAATYHPAQDLILALVDTVSEATLGRPLRPDLRLTPAGLLRGELDLVKVELPAYAVAGLVIDRFVVRAKRVRVRPGVPPVLVAGPVWLEVVVSQANVDRWTKDLRLPLRLRLTEEGVITSAGLGGIRMTEVVTEPTVVGGFVQLRPTRASLLGVPTTLVRFLRGYLPLPPLPRSARLDRVEPSDGELTVVFRIDRFEQPLTPDVTTGLRRLLNLPLPGLR
jgi:hypothetical protein